MSRYVGARYVPLYDGIWDNTKAYEPLTVVTYVGNSYTSKKYVPVGVSIDNTEYWVMSGEYNQQMANINAELQAQASDIRDLQDDNTRLQGEIDNLDSARLEHETAIQGLETTTQNLDTNKLSKSALKDMFVMEPKVVEIDSLGAHTTVSGSVNIEKNGYTPLALRGWTMSTFMVDALSVGTTAASYTVTNTRDTATGGVFSIVILYVKNS